MIDKEETSQTILGIGRADGCALNSISHTQEAGILGTLALTDEVDKIYDNQDGVLALATALRQSTERYEQIVTLLPDKDLRTMLLGTTLRAYEHCVTLA